MLEGSREFDIVWGTATALICFTLGLMTLSNWSRARHTGEASIFGGSADPSRRLQLAWGVFAMIMGGTNVGCRYIAHRYLIGVHEAFFALTIAVVVVLLPALVGYTRRSYRRARKARAA